ncbi:MAG: Rne/Rng family ribonuclease [Peptococcaceae bacterium]|nr:Rne/Rng family ribonuclease [Peptococcaceae bacterium]
MQQIIIQNDSRQMQVAVLEDGHLAEYAVHRVDDSPANGSIYRGIVESVLPGMQAAFVDIGWEKNAYLALEDVALPDEMEGCHPNIGDVLKAGQSVVVQIKKEAVDAKGPKVSSKLSIPGRTLVLVPGKPYAAVSKKISPDRKRQALKELTDELLKDQQCGLIVRTAGQNCTAWELTQEFQWLLNRWNQLQQKIAQVQKPGLIQADQDLAAQMIRDCAREDDLEGIYVNDFALYEELQQQIMQKKVRFKIRWREENLIEQFGLEAAIRSIHSRKIWLKNGGYVVFDRTEALNVIDVNTGKFTGKQDFQDTIVQMNLEAAEAIAWQIRLRNLSGMILIDFIDMQQTEDQNLVLEKLEALLKQDRVKTTVHGMTQLGLVEMTRKKMRAPLTETLEQPCPFCMERGRVDSAATIGLRILEKLEQEAARTEKPVLTVSCYPSVAAWLLGEGQLQNIEQQYQKEILLRGDSALSMSEFAVAAQNKENCGDILPVHKGEVLQVKIEDRYQNNKKDGIARINGYVLHVSGAGHLAGADKTVLVEISHVMRSHAEASLLNLSDSGEGNP